MTVPPKFILLTLIFVVSYAQPIFVGLMALLLFLAARRVLPWWVGAVLVLGWVFLINYATKLSQQPGPAPGEAPITFPEDAAAG